MIPFQAWDSLNGTLMFLSLCIFWYILRDISKRIGQALQMRKYYRWYDLSAVLLLAAYTAGFIELVLNLSFDVSGIDILYLAARLVFIAAAIMMVAVTVRYWSWIVPEVLALRKK